MTHILDIPKQRSASFVRKDGHHLHVGVIVAYVLTDKSFEIIISREAIQIRGQFPPCSRNGIEALTQMLARAVRHHEHLKGFAFGEPQSSLDERILEAEEAAGSISGLSTVQ